MRISDWSSDVCSSDLSVNHPPEIVSTPFEEPIVEGDEYSYNAHASDPDDGDDLTWVLQAGPDEADIDSDSGDVTWTPGEGDAGHHDLVIRVERSEEHTSELQSLMRISYAVFCLKKNK